MQWGGGGCFSWGLIPIQLSWVLGIPRDLLLAHSLSAKLPVMYVCQADGRSDSTGWDLCMGKIMN